MSNLVSDKREDVIDYIPGAPEIKPTDLMSYLQSTDITTVVHRIIYKAFGDVKKADFILCNTVEELESDTILAIHKNQPCYAIGPLFPTGFAKSPVPMNMWSESDCTHFLTTRPTGSVLYISFGSYAHTSKHNIAEIAHGLLLSGVNFIWVIRPDIVSSGETQPLPAGFEDQIKHRGLLVPWCSQIEVVSHPAVGGFLTHCGWNSILESVWCTVPMLCYPLLTDQFTNRKLVVDDWKIGINLRDGRQVMKEEVSEKVIRLMSGKTADGLRKQIKNVRKTLQNSVSAVGSSERNFGQFAKEVDDKIHRMGADRPVPESSSLYY